MWQRLVVVALGVGLLGAACDLGVRVPSPTGGECRSDFDCPLDALCATGACVRVPRAGTFDLLLTPPNDSGYPKQQVTEVRVSAAAGSVGQLVLQAASVVSGRVLLPGSPPTSVRGRVEAVRAGEIPGTTLRVTAATTTVDGEAQYRVSLAPGVYDLRVFPEDPTLPPVLTFPGVDATRSVRRDLALPAAGDYRRVSGRVASSVAARLGFSDVLVQAFSTSNAPLSAVARTDELGRFVLAVLPGESTISLRVTRAPDGPTIPTVERTSVTLPGGDGVDVGTVALGLFEAPTPVVGRVTARDRDEPVRDATVIVSGRIGEGQWLEQRTTDASGEFVAALPPGRYALEIRPPNESELAIYTGPLLVPSSGTGSWPLGRKNALSGTLLGPDGRKPVAQALVEATRRGVVPSDTASWRYLRTTSTDAEGRYQLRLDPGVYDLSFAPEGQPLARLDVSGVTVGTEDVRVDGRLPEAMAVTGVLRDAAGRPFAGVAVEVFERTAGSSAPARVLGAGVSDAAGAYRVVVPTTAAALLLIRP